MQDINRPPYDLTAGRAIIGHRLLHPDRTHWCRPPNEAIQVDDFTNPQHQAIYRTIRNLCEANSPVTIDLVSELLCFWQEYETLEELDEIVKTIATKTIGA